jgi:hypothetical protein
VETYTVRHDSPLPIPRAGRTLTIINASTLITPWLSRDVIPIAPDSFTEIDLLVGFDRTPDLANLDGIAPASAVTTLDVPTRVGNVILNQPSRGPAGNRSLSHSSSQSGVTILVGWADCESPSSIVPLGARMPNSSGSLPSHYLDAQAMTWPMSPTMPIYDLNFQGGRPNWMRPMIAPSAVDVIHAVTAINTIFSMLGPRNWLSARTDGSSRLVHRIYVSVSAATLVVIGSNGLTVGSPGAEEIWRGLVPAGQVVPIEFGEGMEVDRGTNATAGWRAYTAAAVTLEASVVGG